jgi:peptidyl-prolyl cis-trans isomerase SurA
MDLGRIRMMMHRWIFRTAQPLAIAAICLSSYALASDAASTADTSSAVSLSKLYGTPVEEIVARVNDRVITNTDLLRAQQQLDQEASQENLSPDELAKRQKNLLRDQIDRELLLSKGKELGITGDTELIKSLDEIRKQNHLNSMDDLERAVEAQGTSYEDFKANIRDNIIQQEVIRDQVSSKLLPSPKLFHQYYDEHKQSFAQQESVTLNEILIPTPENATDAQISDAAAKANAIEQQLKSGADFATLAKQDSAGPTAQQGGDLGAFHRGALAKVLEDQTFSLPVGGYTQPIRTRQGYVILKVTQHIPGGIPTYDEVEPQVEQAVYMQQMQPALRQYLTKLREEAYIDIRPGYVDTGASSNETKPIYSAYTPPLTKEQKRKLAYERRRQKAILSARKKKNSRQKKQADLAKLAAMQSGQHHKKKQERVRYGRAPLFNVDEAQIQQPAAAAPATGNTVAADVPAPYTQPLGQDLTHDPNAPVKKGKMRLRDEAAEQHAAEAKKRKLEKHTKHAKKSKQQPLQPSGPSTTEAAAQQVQSAPLGLSGDTAKKKKKKKQAGKPGVKTRMSDEKKPQASTPAATPGTSSSSSSSSAMPAQ